MDGWRARKRRRGGRWLGGSEEHGRSRDTRLTMTYPIGASVTLRAAGALLDGGRCSLSI